MNDKSIKQMAGYTLLYDWEWANEFSHISDNKIAWLKRGWTVRHSFSEMKCDHSIKIGAVWAKRYIFRSRAVVEVGAVII